jgi:hypothetical protein
VRNPLRRKHIYHTVHVPPTDSIIIRQLGTMFPDVLNNTDRRVRISFPLVGTDDWRSVDIAPREIAPFHVTDGQLRANVIEFVD